jgi:hypothetical protein
MKTPGLVPGFFYVLIYKYGPMIVIPSNGKTRVIRPRATMLKVEQMVSCQASVGRYASGLSFKGLAQPQTNRKYRDPDTLVDASENVQSHSRVVPEAAGL